MAASLAASEKMAFSRRQIVLTARLAALAGIVAGRGRTRRLSWMAHDFLWLYPTLRRNCEWHGPVVTRFETDQREIWLTIDDGPDPRDTPEILDLLARHDARATFFVIGKKVDRHRDLVRRIIEEGHTLGNHTHSHPSALWWGFPGPCVRREIARGNESLAAATGTVPALFRSPVGMNNRHIHPAAHASGQRVIGWSAEGGDGCPATPTRIVNRIMSGIRPGAIALLHESGGSRHRVLTLARLLERLSAEGYRCVIPPESSLR